MSAKLSPEEYLTEKELAALWNVGVNTLQKWRCYGVGPKYIKRVGRIVYHRDDLIEFEREQKRTGVHSKPKGN